MTTLLLSLPIPMHLRYPPSNGFNVGVGQSPSNYILGHRRGKFWLAGLRRGCINGKVGWRSRAEGHREGII